MSMRQLRCSDSDSGTDPDMPELVKVERSPYQDHSEHVALGQPKAVGPAKLADPDNVRALRILNRIEDAEKNKYNMMWSNEATELQQESDTYKMLDTQALSRDEQKKMMSIADVPYTIPGGLPSTMKTLCARAGCENPSRGSGGTSKYCSLACMEQDEGEDECLPADAQAECVGPTIGITSFQASNMEAAVEELDIPQEAKIAAMSMERFEENFQSAQPLRSIIFLDVDGVLNATTDEGVDVITSDTPMMFLNRTCLQRFVKLVRDSCAHAVLSSTWRMSAALKADLWEALVAEGLPENAFIGQTPVIDFSLRHHEIKEWLDRNLGTPSNLTVDATLPWVVLDDMKLGACSEVKDHFVWVDPSIGLSDTDSGIAAQMLCTCALCGT